MTVFLPLGADDHALVDEQVGDLDRGAEQPARIVAEVEDQRLHPLGLELDRAPS